MATIKKTGWSCSGMIWEHDDEIPSCDECGRTAEETQLSSTAHSGGVICGGVDCWNNYMMNNVFTDIIESNDVYVCDICETTDSLEFKCINDECLEEGEQND